MIIFLDISPGPILKRLQIGPIHFHCLCFCVLNISNTVVCNTVCITHSMQYHLAVKLGTVVQIQNITESWFSRSLLLLRLDAHAGCQIEGIQQERSQLTMEGNKPYNLSC